MACSVGIMAYNEEANIADAIGTILGQELRSSHVAELIVVASGCEDGTVATEVRSGTGLRATSGV